MQETIALVTATSTIVGTLLGSLLSTWRFRAERQQWRRELDRWLTDLRARQDEQRLRLLERTLDRRFSTYGPVLALLGRVRDYNSPDGSHFNELKENPALLSEVSSGLVGHLYGEAGLVMEMDTRNALVEAVQVAEEFRLGHASLEDLCEVFFMARRFLRSDLQICDYPQVKGQLDKMQENFNLLLEERRKAFAADLSNERQSIKLSA